MADRPPARSLTVRAVRARRRAALVARAVGVAGVAALGLSSALVVWAAVRSPHRYGGLIGLLGASAVVVIAAGAAARRFGACGTGVAVVGAMFVVSQVDRGASIAAPVVFGCGLLIRMQRRPRPGEITLAKLLPALLRQVAWRRGAAPTTGNEHYEGNY